MTNLALLGAGKIGTAITALLGPTGDYRLTVVDSDAALLERSRAAGLDTRALDLADTAAVTQALRGHDVALSACPYYLAPAIGEAARAAGVHYFDLTEDVEGARRIREIARDAPTAFVPQCGLAPGFVGIVACDLARRFDPARDVFLRVGALPVYPTNALLYNLTWSTDGLINEYCNPCEAIVDGRYVETPPLEEVDRFSLDGVAYEAFNTSGGLGTLWETLAGQVQNLNYKTVRYPGHRDAMKLLLRDLRLGERRALLKDVLETALPMTWQDVVLVFVTVSGWRDGQLVQESYAKKIYGQTVEGRQLSAIQLTTAAGVCAMVDLLVAGRLPQRGFVRQEEARLDEFLANRFGRYFA